MSATSQRMRDLAQVGALHRPGSTVCEGCQDMPWPGCACCGGRAEYVSVAGFAATGLRHMVTYCAACWQTLLAVRRGHEEGYKLAPLEWRQLGREEG